MAEYASLDKGNDAHVYISVDNVGGVEDAGVEYRLNPFGIAYS